MMSLIVELLCTKRRGSKPTASTLQTKHRFTIPNPNPEPAHTRYEKKQRNSSLLNPRTPQTRSNNVFLSGPSPTRNLRTASPRPATPCTQRDC